MRRTASALALAAAVWAVAAAATPVASAQAADGDWSCSIPSGYTWDNTDFRLPCSPQNNFYQQAYHLRTPANNLWACSVPSGFTWDQDVSRADQCSRYAEAPTYHLRTPVDGLTACSVPNGFTYDQVSFSSNCTAYGPGLAYRLRAAVPVTISASHASVDREPPATAPVLITWTARAPVRVYVSVDGGAETLFASSTGNGTKTANIASPHTYVFRVYGQGNHDHVFATTTVRGTVRQLSSVSPCAARRPDGKIDVFVRAGDGNAAVSTLTSSGRVVTPWTGLGRPVLGPPCGSWTNDGRTLDVFAVGTDHQVYHRRYVVGSAWSAVTKLPGMAVASDRVGVARFAGGLSLFARGNDSQAYRTTFWNSGAVDAWLGMGKLTVGAPSAAWTADGSRLEVFLVGNDYVTYRQQRLNGNWLAWQALDDGFSAGSATVTVASRRDIERTLFARGVNGEIWRRARTPTGDRLYPWQSMHRQTRGAPAASWTADGTVIDIESVDPDNRIVRRHRMPSAWLDWANSQVASATVGLTENADKRHVFMRGNDGDAWSGEFPRPGFTLPWQSMGRPIVDAAPAASWTPDRTTRVETLVGTDQRMYWRRTVPGGYTAWALVPGGAPSVRGGTAISGYADRVTIAVRSTNNSVFVMSMTIGGRVVRPWQNLGGPVLGTPALSWLPNGRKLDVVAVGTNGRIYRKRFVRDFGWGVWREVPGAMRSEDGSIGIAGHRDPASGTARISIFVRGTDGVARMVTMTRSGRLTSPWTSIAKEVLGAPSGSWSSDGRMLTVTAVGVDYVVWYRRWINGAWSGWMTLPINASTAPFYVLPASAPGTSGPLLGVADAVVRPPVQALSGALSASKLAPSPSGAFPGTPSGGPQG